MDADINDIKHTKEACPFCLCGDTRVLGPHTEPTSTHAKGYQIECINCGARGPCGMMLPHGAAKAWDNGDNNIRITTEKRAEKKAAEIKQRAIKTLSDPEADVAQLYLLEDLKETIGDDWANKPYLLFVANFIHHTGIYELKAAFTTFDDALVLACKYAKKEIERAGLFTMGEYYQVLNLKTSQFLQIIPEYFIDDESINGVKITYKDF